MKIRPVFFFIAILLAVDNVFIRFRIGGLSYDRLLEFLLFFAFFKSYLLEIKTNSFFKSWNGFIVAFALLQVAINIRLAVIGKIDFELVYTQFIKCFSFLAFSYLFLLIAKKGRTYIDIILVIHLLICVFALLQHPFSPIASSMLEIKRLLYTSVEGGLDKLDTENAYISGGFSDRFRLAGPFASTISFSYFAISSFIISGYMYTKYRKKFYLVMLFTIFIASFLTQTRSLLLAELSFAFGYIYFTPNYRKGLNKIILISLLFLAAVTFYVSQDALVPDNSRLTKITSEGEGDIRPLLWYSGAYAIMTHPLGITDQEYQQVQKEMFVKFGKSGILSLPTHNGIINIGFFYSFLGYILFFFFVKFLLRNIGFLNNAEKVFFNLALVAYLIHTSFHNGFILSTDYPFLMVLMLIGLEIYKLEKKEKIVSG